MAASFYLLLWGSKCSPNTTDANEIEVKFMCPSGNKRNKFNFGNADPVWCPVENVVLEWEAPACDQRQQYSFHDNAINTIEKLMNDMKQQ